MSKWLLMAIVLGLALAASALGVFRVHVTASASRLQDFVSPGKLSAAHAFLESDCSACHTPLHGIEAAKCIACHANNETLLQRQPTAFHSSIDQCSAGCHLEHQGAGMRPTAMNHAALAWIGLGETDASAPQRLLNCATCHATKDRHVGLFGSDCSLCHGTERWTITGYVHPSPRSSDCAQCHQAPPSHYMEHFRMVSEKVAGMEHAQVNQCFLCHQTTAWNDIKRVGWYKHH
jgi:hypothetical protein